MLLSMTGFGRTKVDFQNKSILIEVRSLNSKFTDTRFKIPQSYKEMESEIRRIILENIERGKIELTIDINSAEGDEDFSLNVPLLKRYYKELTKIAHELAAPQEELLAAILRLPNVVGAEDGTVSDAEWKEVNKGLMVAIKELNEFRRSDGLAMENDLILRIKTIQSCLEEVPPFELERVVRLRDRLMKNLEENFSKEKIDENRFEQEVIYYLEKMDITEEKVRLAQHCTFFIEQISTDSPQKGRNLSFISQEIGREINTLGAKAYSSEIQRLVVKMKDELEKVKEQIANVV